LITLESNAELDGDVLVDEDSSSDAFGGCNAPGFDGARLLEDDAGTSRTGGAGGCGATGFGVTAGCAACAECDSLFRG